MLQFSAHQSYISLYVPSVNIQFPFPSSFCYYQMDRIASRTPRMKFNRRKFRNSFLPRTAFTRIISVSTRELLERSNHARWKSRQIELASDISRSKVSKPFSSVRNSSRLVNGEYVTIEIYTRDCTSSCFLILDSPSSFGGTCSVVTASKL